MFIFTSISYFLIILLLMSMLARARPWIRTPAPGKTLKVLPMNFVSRFQLYRSTLFALLMGVVFGLAAGWLSASTAAIVGTIAAITIFLPMHYTLTTKGVGIGYGIFHPWHDFSGFIARRSNLELSHPSQFGRLTLFVKPAEMDSVLQYVERYVEKK